MTATASLGDSRSVALDGLTRTAIVQYAGASGDFSPLHVDEPAAVAAGFPSVMGHGMWTLAQAANVVADWFGAEAIVDLQARFSAPVWPGDELRVEATVTAVEELETGPIAELSLTAINQHNGVVLTGTAKARPEEVTRLEEAPR